MKLQYKVLWGTCPICKHTLLSVMSYEGGVLITCENKSCEADVILQASVSLGGDNDDFLS